MGPSKESGEVRAGQRRTSDLARYCLFSDPKVSPIVVFGPSAKVALGGCVKDVDSWAFGSDSRWGLHLCEFPRCEV